MNSLLYPPPIPENAGEPPQIIQGLHSLDFEESLVNFYLLKLEKYGVWPVLLFKASLKNKGCTLDLLKMSDAFHLFSVKTNVYYYGKPVFDLLGFIEYVKENPPLTVEGLFGESMTNAFAILAEREILIDSWKLNLCQPN